jgi:hypothetical protein
MMVIENRDEAVSDMLRTANGTAGTTGNAGLDALADAIAERVVARLQAGKDPERLMTVPEAAKYLGRTPSCAT